MTPHVIQLHTPLGKEVLNLHAGDHIELSGIVYTARDEAHIRMLAEGIPFDPAGAAIYHCGPVIKDNKVIAAGPTTSARMNDLSGFLIEKGARAFIGKGGMGGSRAHPVEKPGGLPGIHRGLCCSGLIAHDRTGSIF